MSLMMAVWLIMLHEYVTKSVFTIQSTLVIPALVIRDFGYNGLFFHTRAVSLCFITVTTSVTPVSHIWDLWLQWVSPTLRNSWFCLAIPSWAKLWTVHIGYSVFKCTRLTCQSDRKTACVIWWHFVPGDAEATYKFCTLFGFPTDKVQPLVTIMDKLGQSLHDGFCCSRTSEKVL
jgi:hypothetical protein